MPENSDKISQRSVYFGDFEVFWGGRPAVGHGRFAEKQNTADFVPLGDAQL